MNCSIYVSYLLKVLEEKQLIKLSECRTLMMKFVIVGETMTSKVKTVFRKYFVVLCEYSGNNLMVIELDYGLYTHCSREKT